MSKDRGFSWPPSLVIELRSGLDALAQAVRDRPDARSDEEHIWLTRFLVVRTCGYLEQVSHEAAREYIQGKAGGMVRSFAMSWMERSRNPTPDRLLELVGRFDSSIRDDLKALLDADDQRLHRELSMLVDRRNRIAHGLNEGLGSQKALSIKTDVELVADWLLERLSPERIGVKYRAKRG